jgi:putative ABC transport system ATP-binding protein
MSEEIIIQIKNLTKIYGLGNAQVVALNDIDLTIRENEFVAVMGPSGSGKSTLMNILGCLDKPTSGNYFLAGEDVSQMDKNQLASIRNRKIGFVFQSYNLLPQTSALDNVVLPLLYNRNGRVLSSAEQTQRAGELLKKVGLEDRLHHKPNQLSGGQVQRVAIARALVNDPVLLLADEPTGNLDTRSGEEIMVLLTDLHRQGSTIVMVTHEEEIAAFAQRVVHFRDGCIDKDHLNGRKVESSAEQELQHAGD